MNLRHLHWKYLGAYGSIRFCLGCLQTIEGIPQLSYTAKIRIQSVRMSLHDLEAELKRSYRLTEEQEYRTRAARVELNSRR